MIKLNNKYLQILKRKILKRGLDNSNLYFQSNFNFNKTSDELFLFGNGYTLKTFDLNVINNVDCFICNLFFKIEGFHKFIRRNNVLDFEMDSLKDMEHIAKRHNFLIENILRDYHDIKISGQFHLVRKSDFIDYIIQKNPQQPVITDFGLLRKLVLNKDEQQKIDILKKYIGHTPQFMLLIGILMRYNKIHLYGLEHNYVKDILNKDSNCGTHFYGDTYKEILQGDNGYGLPRDAYKIKLSTLFEGNARTFKGYELLADLAKEMNVEIIDHSNGSLFMFQDYSLWDLVEPPVKN